MIGNWHDLCYALPNSNRAHFLLAFSTTRECSSASEHCYRWVHIVQTLVGPMLATQLGKLCPACKGAYMLGKQRPLLSNAEDLLW